MFLAILLVIVLGLAAYLLPKMFASPSDQVQVPRLAGLTADQARAKLADAGLVAGKPTYDFDNNVAANHVISQDPPADEFVDKGSTVTFMLSRGTHPTKVPYVIGETRQQAQADLEDAHLNPIFQPVESDQPKGQVVETDPAAGEQRAARHRRQRLHLPGSEEGAERGRDDPGRRPSRSSGTPGSCRRCRPTPRRPSRRAP